MIIHLCILPFFLSNASPNGSDIVTRQEYDNLGHVSSQWSLINISGNAGQHIFADVVMNNKTIYSYETPFIVVVKLISAEECLEYDTALHYIDVNKVYKESKDPISD